MNQAARSQPDDEILTVDVLTNGRDEMNLAEFPLVVLADRAPKGAKTLVFKDGTGTLTVIGSELYGLPTASDADVLVALLQLTKQRNNFTQANINFTRYELLKLLGWPNEGKNYRRLDDSLNRWQTVSLHYDGCWWDNRSKRYGDAKIHILESIVILDGTSRLHGDDQQALPLSSFTWNKIFLQSCQAGNLKRLNVEAYFALKHPTSKRLFRFLDKRFYRKSEWVFDLEEIAFERVGLSRNYGHHVGKLKEKLQPAIIELEGSDFLEPMTQDQRYFKEGTGWKIRFIQRQLCSSAPELPASEASEPPTLVMELVKRSVTRSAAEELVRQFPAELISQKIETFDWLEAKQDKRVAKSPAGYLVKSIQDDYAVPKGFVSKAELERRAEAKRQKDADAAAARQRQREQNATEKAERRAIIAHREGLNPAQLAQLEVDAIAQADDQTRQLLEQTQDRTLRRMFLGSIIDQHIRQLLKSQTEPA